MTADDVFTWANWFLLASLVIGVISTYAIVASGKLRDEQSKQELAQARTEAAKANEKAAQLEKDAAVAHLETERLKGLMAWRRITAQQHASLVAALKGKVTAKVWVEFVVSDPEATQFHADIWQMLKDAGVEVLWYSGWDRAVGLQITNATSPTGTLLRKAFGDVGFIFQVRSEPGVKSAGSEVEIIVGSKPPEFYTSENGPVKAH